MRCCPKANFHHPDHKPNGNGNPGNGVYECVGHVVWDKSASLRTDDLRSAS